MNKYVLLPLIFLKFWYFDAPQGLLGFFASFNGAFFQLFSLPLFLKTFFKPLKNEYREGLVGFSRAMGIVVKTPLIVIDTAFLLIILSVEIIAMFAFLAFPIATVYILFL